MSILQAILIGALYWIECGEIFVPFTYAFTDLMFVSMLTGLILGDVTTGVIVGGTIQPMYLALTAVGGAKPVDKCAAGIISTSMVITQGISLGEALVVAAAASLIMAQLNTINRVVQVWTVHRCDKCAAAGDSKALTRAIFIYGDAIRAVCFWIPMTLICKFGVEGLGILMNGLPEWAENMFNVAGGIMPALGFAMVIMVIGKGKLIPFFVAGFFIAQYTGISSIAGCLIGVFLGWFYLVATNKEDDGGSIFGGLLGGIQEKKSKREEEEFWKSKLISKRTFRKTWLYWRLAICHVDNVERLQAAGMAFAMVPALKELYPDNKEAQIDGMQRHMEFFITENMIGGIIPGVVLSLEEERAMQLRNNPDEEPTVSGDLINSVKAGMMGPFAGIGDTLNYATIKPLLCAFFMTYAQEGAIWAVIVYDVLLYVILVGEGWFMYNSGYRLGTKSATTILQNNAIQKVITFFSILGLFVMGVLASENVSVALNITIPKSTEIVSLQEVLIDAIAPGILPFAVVMGVYLYLKNGKRANNLKATLWLLVIALVLGGLNILTA